jgi:hypothetical protein
MNPFADDGKKQERFRLRVECCGRVGGWRKGIRGEGGSVVACGGRPRPGVVWILYKCLSGSQ